MLVDALKSALGVQQRNALTDTGTHWHPNGHSSAAWLPWITDTGDGVDMSPDAIYASQPAVRTVVTFRADNAAGVPIHGFRKTDDGIKQRADGSSLDRLLAQPSPTVTGYRFVGNLMLDRDLWDRHASTLRYTDTDGWRLDRIPPRRWVFNRDGRDQPTSIKIINADLTTLKTLSLEQCFWMDNYPSTARTPMECIRDMLIEQHESTAARRDMWKNKARIPGFLKRPLDAGEWAPDARDNFKASWQEYAAAGSRTGKTPVLEDGMDYVSAQSMSSVDAQQLETSLHYLRMIAAFFKTPSVLVGDNEGANYSNVEAYRELVYTDALGNDFADIESALNSRVTPRVADDPGEFAEFHVGARLRMSFKTQADIYQKAGGVPHKAVNEIRAEQNLPPSPNPDHDLPIIPINVKPPHDPSAGRPVTE